MSNQTRRGFMCATTAATVGFLGGTSAFGQAPSSWVRRSIFSPNAPIASYRRGVGVMKARPASDPTSWRYQANMHGTYTAPPAGALWNQCQHGSFFFLSWHRMYLYWFERIVRAASQDNTFALPYWNYTSTTASTRALPLAFRQPSFNGQPNPLYDASRAAGMNNITNPAVLPYSATLFSTAFAYANFSSPAGSSASFGGQALTAPSHFTGPHGQLESQPHDVIHGLIGGPNGDMGDPNLAARDAIFWLHHANIDRLWKRWLQQGGGRTNPTGNSAWMNTTFRFYNESGTLVPMKGSDILNTLTQLQYRYDDDPVVLGPAFAILSEEGPAQEQREAAPVETVATAERTGVPLGSLPVRVPLALKEPAKAAVERLATAKPAEAVNAPLTLTLEDVTFDKQPGIYYEVYLNVPDEDDDPQIHNGHYIGNVGFFGKFPAEGMPAEHGATAEGAKTSFTFDISGVVRSLHQAKKWDPDKINVLIVPRGLEDSHGNRLPVRTEAKIKVGKITLSRPTS